MKLNHINKLASFAFALASLSVPHAFAGKPGGGSGGGSNAGVVTIDQDRAANGGVTSGDAPGFPVTLSEPGSYRLESNLTVPDASTTAIEITADDVTVDMNGFIIAGPNVCPSPDSCTFSGGGKGILATSGTGHTTVVGGTVRGMGGAGIVLGKNARVERMHVEQNGSSGIAVGLNSLVSDCTSQLNYTFGVYALNGSLVLRNVISYNRNGAYFHDDMPAATTVAMGSNVFFLNSIVAVSGSPVQILPNVCFGNNCF